MGRMQVISFAGVVVILLLLCDSTRAQREFTVVESKESTTVGRIENLVGTNITNIRFQDASCREVFAIDENGVITTTRGIDRESNFTRVNADEGNRLSCTIAYSTEDGNNNTIRIEVTIADINDNAPEFQNNTTEYSVVENTFAGGTIDSLTVKDPDYGDNGTVDNIVMSGEGVEFFNLSEIRSTTGTARVTLMTSNIPIDFEKHQQFNLTFNITDRGTPPLTTVTVLTINVVNLNERSPVFAFTRYTFKDVPNDSPIGTPIGNVSATDTDEGDFGIVLYRISIVNDGMTSSCGDSSDSLFAINSTTGVLYLNQSADGIKCTFIIMVDAYNEGDTVKAGGTATVHVSIVVARLVFQYRGRDIDYFNKTLEENSPQSYTIGVMFASSLDNYTIEVDGEEERQYIAVIIITNNVFLDFSSIDREEVPVISGRLTVYDGDAQGTLDFYITVLDINDNYPVFQITNFLVLENRPVGYEIGRIVAVDPDEGENAEVSYTMLNSSELLTLHSNGSLYVNGMIDFEQVESIRLRVRAQDGGTPSKYKDGDINIVIENVNDNLPIFSDENYTQIILTSSSLPITWNVTATDDDSGEYGMVTYRMVVGSSNDASTFVNLDSVTGQLNVTELPAPSATPYQLVVEAVDGGNGINNISIPIHVWTDFCEHSPCANGGTCTNEFNSYRCDCTAEYGGMNCSILKNPCDKISPCRNSATCSDTEDQLDYRCDCTDSYSGRNCMYSSVSFKPRSFQKYQIPGVSADSVHVSMQIAPKSLNGLLLYVGDNNKFISMGLENGMAVVRTQGNGEARDETVMDAGTWYRVTIRKSKMELSLNVSTWSSLDNVEISSNIDQSQDDQQMDSVANILFIGGLSADLTISDEHIISRDYIGCMRDLFINGNHVQQLIGDEDRLLVTHNVDEKCDLSRPSQSCAAKCRREGCIDFLISDPYCDCTVSSANCTDDAVPTAVGFTGQANLIVETKDDFFIATQENKQKLQATEPDVRQRVSFSFRSTAKEAVLLSSASDSTSLRVFWFGNNSLNYDIYQANTRCGHVSVTGGFGDDTVYNVRLTVRDSGVTLYVNGDHNTTETTRCPSNLFVEQPSSTITITGRPAMHLSATLPDKDFHGCISDLTIDEVTVPLAKQYESDLVTLQEEGSVNEVHDLCQLESSGITGDDEEGPFLDLYIIVIIGVVVILFLVVCGILVVCLIRKCLHSGPRKSRYDMPQDSSDVGQDSPPGTLNFRKKKDFDNASVGHYQEEGEEAMPDNTAISIDSLRKSACNSSNSGTASSSAETGFHTGSERDHNSDAGYPEPTASMVNEETPSEVQESEYSTFISDSDNTSAVEQTLSPLDVQLLGPPNVLGISPQARGMVRKPSPRNPALLPMERKISPFHHHPHSSRFSMSTIESGSELSLGPPPPDTILNYPHPSSIPHEPQLPGLKTLCGPDFNPISYWEQQSRLKPSIDPDYPLQRLSLASGRGTEDPSSTVSVASTLEEQHEFASQGGGEGEATNMRDGLESDHELELNYRLADLQIPEYESMTLSQSTVVGGSEDYFPDAHPLVPVHDNSVSSNSPYNIPDYRHSPQSVSSSSTSYSKNPHQRLFSEQDLSMHNRYYDPRSRTRPSHMISDHRLHAQYSNTSTSSASTPQTRRAWRSEDPINV